MGRRSYKDKYEEAQQHKLKLVKDLVDFAVAWKELKDYTSISTKALGNYVTLDTMSDIVLETFTKPKEKGEDCGTKEN